VDGSAIARRYGGHSLELAATSADRHEAMKVIGEMHWIVADGGSPWLRIR